MALIHCRGNAARMCNLHLCDLFLALRHKLYCCVFVLALDHDS